MNQDSWTFMHAIETEHVPMIEGSMLLFFLITLAKHKAERMQDIILDCPNSLTLTCNNYFSLLPIASLSHLLLHLLKLSFDL